MKTRFMDPKGYINRKSEFATVLMLSDIEPERAQV